MAVSRRPLRSMPGKTGLPKESVNPSIQYANIDPNTYSRFFYFFGCSIHKVTTKEFRGDCPFPSCENPKDHFYVNGSTGQWDCKRCGKHGNIYTFMRQLHAEYNKRMTPEDYEWLMEQRAGISKEMFRLYGVCRMGPETVMLPSYNLDKEVSSLPLWKFMYDAKTTVTKKVVANPPIVKTMPFSLQFYSDSKTNIDIVEGQWDALAHATMLSLAIDPKKKTKLLDHYAIIGSPGSGSFPREYLQLLEGKNVRILFDNDSAGMSGVDKLLRDISNSGIVPRSVLSLSWPSDYPQGYDLRDLVAKGLK